MLFARFIQSITSITFSFRYNSSSLRFGLIPWQFQNKMFAPMKLVKGYLSWLKMLYDGLQWVEPLGGLRLLGVALGILLGGKMDFSTVDTFEMGLETGLTLVLMNLNGTGGAGPLREPIDSNRPFQVMSTFIIVLAASETLRHMLDFKSSVSCFGFG